MTKNNLLVSTVDSSFFSYAVSIHPCLTGHPNAHVGPHMGD